MRFTVACAAMTLSVTFATCGGNPSARLSNGCTNASPLAPSSPILDRSAHPDPLLVKHLAVLRRPQRRRDLPQSLRRGLAGQISLQRVALSGIRYLGRAVTGERFYLVPATIRDSFCPPTGKLTPAQMRRLRTFEQQIALRTHRVGLALVPQGPGQASEIAYSDGSLYSDVRANHLIALFDGPGNRTATLAGVTPDGVTAVRLTYDAHTTTIRVSAGTNFWSTRVPAPIPDVHARFTWMNGHGQIVARFSGLTEALY
jgi:hypothetical protein